MKFFTLEGKVTNAKFNEPNLKELESLSKLGCREKRKKIAW